MNPNSTALVDEQLPGIQLVLGAEALDDDNIDNTKNTLENALQLIDSLKMRSH